MLWKVSITSSWITKLFFIENFPLLYLSCVISHNSQIFLYLNGINPWIEHLDIFWNMWNLILWYEREGGSRCFGYYKSGAFIPGRSKQKFNMQSHFVIFLPVVREDTFYDEAASHALVCICYFFGNLWLLYLSSSFLYLCRILFNAKLIYNISNLNNCVNHHLFKANWISIALIQVSHPYVILFMLIIGFMCFGAYFLR